jgi:hypothetical protein
MAHTDRDKGYMQETFGTTSLVTDYQPVKNDVLTIEDIIAQLKHISSPTEAEIEETLSGQSLPNETFFFDFGHRVGMKRCAELTLQLLEKLQ